MGAVVSAYDVRPVVREQVRKGKERKGNEKLWVVESVTQRERERERERELEKYYLCVCYQGGRGRQGQGG